MQRLGSNDVQNSVQKQWKVFRQIKSEFRASAHTLYARTIEVAVQRSLQNADWEDDKNNGKDYKLHDDARIDFHHGEAYARCLVTRIRAKWLALKGELGQAL